MIRGVEMIIEEGNLKERIRRAQKGDKKVVKAVEELKRAGIKMLKDEEWEIEDGLVTKKGRIYILEGELRREIIQLYYDISIEEHGGR